MQTMQMMGSTLEEHIEHTGGRSPASTPSSLSHSQFWKNCLLQKKAIGSQVPKCLKVKEVLCAVGSGGFMMILELILFKY
jgi:hypothetical protein